MEDKSVWILSRSSDELTDFIRPYIGNGYIGNCFDRFGVISWEAPPAYVQASGVYEDGSMLRFPAWNHVDISIAENKRSWNEGIGHDTTLALDTSSGEVVSRDCWEYMTGRFAAIHSRILIPRSFGKASLLIIEIDAPDEIEIFFGLNGNGLDDSLKMTFQNGSGFICGNYNGAETGQSIRQELRWSASNPLSTVFETTPFASGIKVRSKAGQLRLEIRHCLFCSDDDIDTSFFVCDLDEILRVNNRDWKSLWERAIKVEKLPAPFRDMTRAFIFYLLCSLNSEGWALGPVGLSSTAWGGAQFWDTDLWFFRPLLKMWPEFALSIIEYRVRGLDAARENAGKFGLSGAFFDWKTDDRGIGKSDPAYAGELHVNMWIALAAYEYYQKTGDEGYLKKKAWPLIKNISLALLGWGSFEEDGRFHMRKVLGPNESVSEVYHRSCDDNFLTNFATAKVFEIAVIVAGICGDTLPDEIALAAASMYLPEPDDSEIYPEFYGYAGEGIKQADMILTMYPLGFDPGKDAAIKNLDFYHDKVMNYGPFMTSGIESCIMIKYGQVDRAMEHIADEINKFCSNPFMVVRETQDKNSCTTFLTGVCAFLHVMIAYLDRRFVDNCYD